MIIIVAPYTPHYRYPPLGTARHLATPTPHVSARVDSPASTLAKLFGLFDGSIVDTSKRMRRRFLGARYIYY